VGTKDVVRQNGVRIKTNGDFTTINLTIRPVAATGAGSGAPAYKTEAPLYLVILEEAPESRQTSPGGYDLALAARDAYPSEHTRQGVNAADRIAQLQQELRAKEEYLQTANEELETSNEELKSSNEEMQSVNEELQSTNEELETSKEELQSVNEELATVNAELQTKVGDLSKANNDMNNLLAGTGIATIFVDHKLNILRFTPTATRIINLIQSDLGRPVAHIASNLKGYDCLITDVQAVLDNLIPQEREVQTIENKWYNMRIQPYRTTDNVIEGAVITFIDITDRKKLQEALRKVDEPHRLSVVLRDAHDTITMQDLDGSILAWNPGAERMYGWSEAEALAMNVRELIPDNMRKDEIGKLRQLAEGKMLESYLTQRIIKGGSIIKVSIISTALVDEEGKIYAIATTERAMKGGT